jgi:hypothetical protein
VRLVLICRHWTAGDGEPQPASASADAVTVVCRHAVATGTDADHEVSAPSWRSRPPRPAARLIAAGDNSKAVVYGDQVAMRNPTSDM